MRLNRSNLKPNLLLLPFWAERFEVPDVNYLRDFAMFSEAFLERAEHRSTGNSDRMDSFPYPKGSGRVRWLSLLSPSDLLLTRTLAGQIVSRTDSLLPRAVYSYRLETPPPAWRFESPRKAHRALRKEAMRLLMLLGGAMSRLDVAAYYPSISVERLREMLLAWSCNPQAIEHLCALLEQWQLFDGLVGIPVGPEAFGVVGNAYLLPLDVRFQALGITHLRYVDDIFIFGPARERTMDATGIALEELELLSLGQKEEKAAHFASYQDAAKSVEDGMLTSLFVTGPRLGKRHFQKLTERRFDEYILGTENPELRHFRAILQALKNQRSNHAAHYLAMDVSLLNIDPYLMSDYLREVSLGDRTLMETLVEVVRTSPAGQHDQYDGRDLHLFRLFSARIWPRIEGSVFWETALDTSRRDPVRAWALMAAARSPAWNVREVLERVLEDDGIYFRRACLLSLRRERHNRQVRNLIRHVRRYVPDLFTASLWLEEK